jgi:hypothetical protein
MLRFVASIRETYQTFTLKHHSLFSGGSIIIPSRTSIFLLKPFLIPSWYEIK